MTAIEFLIDQFSKYYAIHQLEDEINQAKAMEKQQLSDAWYAGDEDGPIHDFEDYYQETYGSKGSDEQLKLK